MKHQDEFRDRETAGFLADAIARRSTRPAVLMEICGTHTVSIFRHGIRDLLPEHIELVSGPGCPVCVTATEEIDRAVKLARLPGVRLATFGDLIRVPGSQSSLKREMAAGARVSLVYSPLDAIELAIKNPDDQIVFLGIGFETTAPTVAAAVLTAHRQGLRNFSILAAHKLLPPAMKALLSGGDLKIDGFICPGHVTTIIGADAYRETADQYRTPCVVTGFEPVDILQGVLMLVDLIEKDEFRVEIQYKRGATAQGNLKARGMMNEVFEPVDAPWRGLGVIPRSGLGFREPFRYLDAGRRFDLSVPRAKPVPGCRCGDILRGVAAPTECRLFGSACTPQKPVGPCMVSTEGACAAYYKYNG